MRFKNVKLLQELKESPYPRNPYPWTEYSADDPGISQRHEPVYVVGKLRPWDPYSEYILYADGDIMIGESDDQ